MDLKTYISNSPRGTASGLARALSISPSYLSQMASGLAPISPERAVAIELATASAVSRRELRPEDWQRIWPEMASEARAA